MAAAQTALNGRSPVRSHGHPATVRKRGRRLAAFTAAAVVLTAWRDSDDGAAADDTPAAPTIEPGADVACGAEPEILTTEAGIEFVRTPEACFENLPGRPRQYRHHHQGGLGRAGRCDR